MEVSVHKAYVREAPQSKTAVLFIHGIFGSPHHFADFVKKVPEHISVYNILLDGHGGTVRAFSESSVSQWRNTVLSTLDRLSARYENIVVAAHSLGALLAMGAADRFADKIKLLFLIAVPLKIVVKPTAMLNSLKVARNRVGPGDKAALAARAATSIAPAEKLWEYAACTPRFLELFEEARRARRAVNALLPETVAFQSGKDELVSLKSCAYLQKNPRIQVRLLEKSMHYYYDEAEYNAMLEHFSECLLPFCAADEGGLPYDRP